jgi:hypothetical protein
MVALKFSTLIDPEKTVVLFDAYKDDLKVFEETLSIKKEEPKLVDTKLEKKKKPKQEEVEMDPDRLILEDESSEEEEAEDDEISDTSSIESLDLEDDQSDLKAVQPPQYVQTLLQMLRVNTDEENAVEMLHVGLRHASGLIRRTAADIHQKGNLDLVSVALARAFLYMEGDFGLPEFPALQYSGLVALVVHSPEKTVK